MYQDVISPDGAGAATALDGALSLIDNGHFEQAVPLLAQAQNLRTSQGSGGSSAESASLKREAQRRRCW